jgi:hypothetical protein
MNKKHIFLAATITSALIYCACTMPNIQIKSDKFKVSTPLKTGTFNIATLLSDAFAGSFPEGFEIYDMINYPGGVQAFLIGYQMDLLDSFNPDDYLSQIKEQMGKMDEIDPGNIDPIYPEPIIVPKLTPDKIEEKMFYFPLKALFEEMENQINHHSTPEISVPVILIPGLPTPNPLPIPPQLQNMPDFMAFNTISNQYNFESVYVQKGKVKLTIKLSPAVGTLDPGLSITLPKISLIEKGSSPRKYLGKDNDPLQQPVTLSSVNNFSTVIIIDIFEGEDIKVDSPPHFIFETDDIVWSYAGLQASFTIDIRPQIGDIELRGAKKLKLGVMSPGLPEDVAEKMQTTLGKIINDGSGGMICILL